MGRGRERVNEREREREGERRGRRGREREGKRRKHWLASTQKKDDSLHKNFWECSSTGKKKEKKNRTACLHNKLK